MTKVSHDSETPANGQQVITACAFIHHNFNGATKVFLPKRAETKKFLPGVYELPGGHIDFGENIVKGLKREIFEEFEVEVKIGDPFAAFDYTNPVKGSHSIEVVYFATILGAPEDVRLHTEDHSAYVWADREALDEVMNAKKVAGDPEYQAICKAFDLLAGVRPNFA